MRSQPTGQITTLIIDDEPLARKTLQILLDGDSDITIIGICGNGDEAVEAIHAQRPDLIFLDVQMPGMDGFEVLDRVDITRMPCVVFVTAYDTYALRAFEVHAVDYLLKHFDDERFERTITRVKTYFREKEVIGLSHRLTALLQDHHRHKEQEGEHSSTSRLAVKSDGRILFLRFDEIDWIEAADQYVQLHIGEQTHLLRDFHGPSGIQTACGSICPYSPLDYCEYRACEGIEITF